MRFAAIVACAATLVACGGRESSSPEAVARAWSSALNRSDDAAAAKLFAPSAEVIQSGALTLHDHADAESWNSRLPCGGRITRVEQQGPNQVLVIFRLEGRPGHACDAPGSLAAAIFRVEGGKIVLWHQTEPPDESPSPPGAPV